MILRVRDLAFAYEEFGGAPPGSSFRLHAVNFEIGENEFVGIAGRSGSGKTTLMQMLNGLLRPNHGQVIVDGEDIHAPGYDLAGLRSRIGLAFQFPESQLFGATVAEDIAFGPNQQGLAKKEVEARTRSALRQVGLSEDFLERNPLTLSEGEKRRVALAGILAMQPEMLVLDEPTASLDARGIAEIKALFRRWHQEGKTIVLVSHDVDLIEELATRILVLDRGTIVFDGSPADLWGVADGELRRSRAAAFQNDVCTRAGLPLPRAVRLRRLLAARGIHGSKLASLLK